MNKKEVIINAIQEKLGKDIVEIDMRANSPYFDTFIICTASNNRNQEAIADEIVQKLSQNHFDFKKIEGKDTDWILVDAYDVICHIFLPEAREKLRLEQLWQDLSSQFHN